MSNTLNGQIFSKGLYSSWCHLSNSILFDAGEGAATTIGNGLTNIEHCFLGHFHGDHVLGLPSIIGCRNMAQGTSRNESTRHHNKPLTIHFPNCVGGPRRDFDDLMRFIEGRNRNWLRYDLKWHEMDVGDEVVIGANTVVRAFPMAHQKNNLTLGYTIVEKRHRLREEFRGQDIRALKKANGWTDKDVMSPYEKNIFAYCLDSYDFDPKHIRDAEVAVMDCTFLNPDDRDDPTHFTFDEATSVATVAGVGTMIAAHISSRYYELPSDRDTDTGMHVRVVDPAYTFAF
jgi:ribonuclease Z